MAARRLAFRALSGWAADDHAAAFSVYEASVEALPPEWPRPDGTAARTFFESRFTPVRIGSGPALVTGYYEPEIPGALERGDVFRHPLHAAPEEMPAGGWFSRAEILAGDLLSGRELVWLESPVEAFLAQVQGSVRVRLRDDTIRRFGFAGKNGHPYRSIGAELIRRGEVPETTMSAGAIRDWCARRPEAVTDLLNHNPSYVFFRPIDLAADRGPLGAMGFPLTPGRSVAVDPAHVPLGAPVWLEAGAVRVLAIAQDTGSAITGPGRADLFCGSGRDAGEVAGAMRLSGRLVALLPDAIAGTVSP